jgi:uncharacterized RDD family membrane protein YckC
VSEAESAAAEFAFEGGGEALPVAVGWPRVLARAVDMLFFYLLFTIGVFGVLGLVLGVLGQIELITTVVESHWLVKAMLPMLAWGVAESLFLPMTGATPGKLMLGLRVVDAQTQGYPRIGGSAMRTFAMLFRGLLLGIPVLSYIAMAYWTSQLMPPCKAPPWDRWARTSVVQARPAGTPAMAVAVFLVLVGIVWTGSAVLGAF